MTTSSYWNAYQSSEDDSPCWYHPSPYQSPYPSSPASADPFPLPPQPPMHSSYTERSQWYTDECSGANQDDEGDLGPGGGVRGRLGEARGGERHAGRDVERLKVGKLYTVEENASYEDMLGGRLGMTGDKTTSAHPSSTTAFATGALKQPRSTYPDLTHPKFPDNAEPYPATSSDTHFTSLDALLAAAAALPDFAPSAVEPPLDFESVYGGPALIQDNQQRFTSYINRPSSSLPPSTPPSSSSSWVSQETPFARPDYSLWQDGRSNEDSRNGPHYSPTSSTCSSSASQHSVLTQLMPNTSFAPDLPFSFYPQWIDFSLQQEDFTAASAAPELGVAQPPMKREQQQPPASDQSPPVKKLRIKRCDGGRQGPPLDEAKRVYKCNQQGCAKAFARPSALTTHKRSHSKEKPFICPVSNCRRAFTVLSNLKRHNKVHAEVDYSGVTSADFETNRIQEIVEVVAV